MDKCFKCCGALDKVSWHGLHPACFCQWFDLPCKQDFTNLNPRGPKESSSSSPEISKNRDSFYHGKYLKYSAQLKGVSYILKVQEDNHKDLPKMEYLCNCIAKILEMKIPPFFLIAFQGKPTFVAKNFMQEYPGGTLHHLYKYLPKKRYDCSTIVKALLKETKRPAAMAHVVEICLYDALEEILQKVVEDSASRQYF